VAGIADGYSKTILISSQVAIMAITVGLANGQVITVEREAATIGRGPGVDVTIASPDIQPLHARIMRVAGRWLVESAGDWLLQVGDSVPGRKQWLQPEQVICLSASGVTLVFEPSVRISRDEQPGMVEDTGLYVEEDGAASSFGPPPLPAHLARAVSATIGFRGRGTVMIGKGTVTFTGKRYLEPGDSKPGSLIVPMSDVADASSNERQVSIAFMLGNALARLTFDAVDSSEATRMATMLSPDEHGMMLRMRTEASGHAIAIDAALPQVFTVMFEGSAEE
jgi:hypothetical protein